ncbi:hypothetical protein JOM56_011065 [Amanita muscaria]
MYIHWASRLVIALMSITFISILTTKPECSSLIFVPLICAKGNITTTASAGSSYRNITSTSLASSFRVLFHKKYGKVTFKTRPSEPEVPDNVWQLMQWCCAEDPKERPTIDHELQGTHLRLGYSRCSFPNCGSPFQLAGGSAPRPPLGGGAAPYTPAES